MGGGGGARAPRAEQPGVVSSDHLRDEIRCHGRLTAMRRSAGQGSVLLVVLGMLSTALQLQVVRASSCRTCHCFPANDASFPCGGLVSRLATMSYRPAPRISLVADFFSLFFLLSFDTGRARFKVQRGRREVKEGTG